jgi:bacterioferritin-associated ferredoxin
MNHDIQDIIVSIVFIIAIWRLYKHFSDTFNNDGCSSSCGACSSELKNIAKIKVKEIA